MEQPSRVIVLVRHGETEWSRLGRHTGRTDIPLTTEGRHQASLIRPVLERWGFTHVLSSPLQRARETCEIAGPGGVAQMRDDLMEWDYGQYEGLTTAEIRQKCPTWSLWHDGVPGGEDAAWVGARVDRVIAEARAVVGPVAVFAHGHLLRVLTARWLGLPPSDGRLFMLETATVSVLSYEREQPVITRWNVRSPVDA
jgi:broad specificity phosphatase PhoE